MSLDLVYLLSASSGGGGAPGLRFGLFAFYFVLKLDINLENSMETIFVMTYTYEITGNQQDEKSVPICHPKI